MFRKNAEKQNCKRKNERRPNEGNGSVRSWRGDVRRNAKPNGNWNERAKKLAWPKKLNSRRSEKRPGKSWKRNG